MKKITNLLSMALLMLCMGLTSCDDVLSVFDNPASNGEREVENVVTPEEEVITEDQMAVTVTADLPTAVLGTFEEGSTGAALAKRLPVVSSEIGPDTRMVLLPGSMFDSNSLSAGEVDALVRLGIKGGYLAVERPTAQQLINFAVLYAAKLVEMQQEQYQQQFNLSEQNAARAARSSEVVRRAQTRISNIERMSGTRAADDDLNAVRAEMIIFGPTDYFMQQPYEAEATVYGSESDSEGNTTEDKAETVKQERTAAVSGEMADAAAEWLNDVVKSQQQSAASRAASRASGGDAINQIMDASETFTFNGNIYLPNWNGGSWYRTNRLSIKVSSWGIHNMESNKDYYYLKENVLMSLGPKKGYNNVYYPVKESWWYDASGYGDYNSWFGAFFSQYKTSMNLTGKGSITLEASSPGTDNNSQTTSITIGSSSSTTTTNGWSWGVSAGFSGENPSASESFGISQSKGYTKGTSFSMGMSQSAKDLKLKRNTDGKKVTWTYDGSLPQYYKSSSGYHCHQTPADILVNDVEMNQEICWSVRNPSEQYTVEVTSAPKLAALIMAYWIDKVAFDPFKNVGEQLRLLGLTGNHKYVDRSDNQTYSHTLLKPFRAQQTWRMNIANVEYVGEQHYGNLTDLQNAVQKAFPDIYVPVFQVADHDETALNTITGVIKASKRIFEQHAEMLENMAKEYGVKKFEIVWSRDKVKSTDAFTVVVCPKATDATQEHVGWVYGSDGKLYPSADYAKGKGASAVGIVAYVNDGSDFGNAATEKASGAGHGLVLALNQICSPGWKYAAYRISKGSGTFASTIGNSMANAKNDFDGLAKTKHLKEKGSSAASVVGYMGAAPKGCTEWFIPSTGQWIAMLCKPGLGGAEIPTGSALNTWFNINGAERLSSVASANGGKGFYNETWTSSGFNGATGIYLVNGSAPRFTWYNSAKDAYVRAAFAF